MPAVGSSVAVWLAYGHAANTTKSEIPFGKGAIAGVIAPEAANNSKEGGAMVPTLFFSIPGSSSMAIMMAALGYVGISTADHFSRTTSVFHTGWRQPSFLPICLQSRCSLRWCPI